MASPQTSSFTKDSIDTYPQLLPLKRGRGRISRACTSCIKSKTKCDDEKPCRRCVKRGTECGREREMDGSEDAPCRVIRRRTNNSTASSLFTSEGPLDGQLSDDGATSNFVESLVAAALESPSSDSFANDNTLIGTEDAIFTNIFDPPMPDLAWPDFIPHDFPFSFDLVQPYEDIDSRKAALANWNAWSDVMNRTDELETGNSPPDYSLSKRVMASEAFQRSPWVCIPRGDDNTFTEDLQLAIPDHFVANPPVATKKGQSRVSQSLPLIRESWTRDRIYSLVERHSDPTLELCRFPTLEYLNILLQLYFKRDSTSAHSYVHEASFDPDRARPELLTILIAAGASRCQIPGAQRIGFALHEKAKMAMVRALDQDMQNCRDLQIGQTMCHWLEISLWSGCHRKLEVAEGWCNNLTTLLRRSGAIHSTFYSKIPKPIRDDESQALARKWLIWAEHESFKRLILRGLMLDINSSIAFVRSTSLSSAELNLVLPASRNLWEARNPVEWKKLYLNQLHAPPLTFQDIAGDLSIIEPWKEAYDVELCTQAALCAQWIRIWAFLDARTFFAKAKATIKHSHSSILLEAQQKEIYEGLMEMKQKLLRLHAFTPDAQIIAEFLIMSLYAPLQDIQRLAGKFGPDEAYGVLPTMHGWFDSDNRALAIWHAGQVLRAARLIPAAGMHEFHATMIFHACLTLWVAVLLSTLASPCPSSAATLPAKQPPEAPSKQTSHNDPEEPLVVLNEDMTEEARKYRLTGRGKPALRLAGEVCVISHPNVIPTAMIDVFKQPDPLNEHIISPLIGKLSALISDLSKALKTPLSEPFE